MGNARGKSALNSKLSPISPEKVRELLSEVDAFFEQHPELNLSSPECLEKFAHRVLMAEWVRNVLQENEVELSEEQTANCIDDLCDGLTESVLRDPDQLSNHLDSALAPNGLVFIAGKWRKAFSA